MRVVAPGDREDRIYYGVEPQRGEHASIFRMDLFAPV